MQNHPFPDPQDSPHTAIGDATGGTTPPPSTRSRARTWGAAAGLLAAGAIGGAALAGSLSASAATPSPTSSTATVEGSSAGGFPAHGSAAHESAEKAVTGASATKAQAAAVKAVGSGTAGAVTTDMTGDGYEVTVTKADGTSTEVHLDSSFTVVTHGGGPGRADGGADHQPAG